MAKNANKGSSDESHVGAKLDATIRILEDLFVLQALSLGVGRESIRAILGLHTSRISKINKGIKQALKRAKTKGEARSG